MIRNTTFGGVLIAAIGILLTILAVSWVSSLIGNGRWDVLVPAAITIGLMIWISRWEIWRS